jgi:uncharacterized protein (TIGR00255 family)
MTGFGVGRATAGTEDITVELKSVNHKFCEVKPRLPRELSSLESLVVKQVKDRISRGAVEVTVRRQAQTQNGQAPVVDVALAREYQRALLELAQALGSTPEVPLPFIASQPGVLRMEERATSPEDGQRALEGALGQALDALVRMREVEGEAICRDLCARLDLVDAGVGELEALAPRAVEEYRARLAERISELARDVAVDPARLVQEVAFFAERTDVAEEMTRLRSHLVQLRALLASPEPAGRRMDFLVQELHREVNTTGSKSQHAQISGQVVALKAEVERIREQVQNLE